MRADRRHGLTLIEVVAALSISGVALLAGVMLLDQVGDAATRITAESVADNSAGNGKRLLLRLLADARASRDSAPRFHGDERSMALASLCDVPSGWAEPCQVELSVDSLGDSARIVIQTDRGELYVAARTAHPVAFRYLDVASRDSAWTRRWSPSIAPPSAIAILGASDTSIFPIGAAR